MSTAFAVLIVIARMFDAAYVAMMTEGSPHTPAIERVADSLPAGFDDLLTASVETGVRNMVLLRDKWQAGEERFNRPGEALYAARLDGQLVGVAGTTHEQHYSEPAMRMRRLFVLPGCRRRGIAPTLARHCMRTGLKAAPILTCNARASVAAAPFWESLGFVAVDLPGITHIYVREPS